MLPHIHIHRWSHDHRSGSREIQSGQKIVRNSPRKFRQDIRGSGSDQQQIGFLRYGDVFDGAFQVWLRTAGVLKKIGDYFFSAESSESEWGNKFARAASHYYLYRKTFLLQ